MRKIFLLFTALVLSVISMQADEVSYGMNRRDTPFSGSIWSAPYTMGDVTLTPSPQITYVGALDYNLPENGTFTVSVPDGKQITKITFSAGAANFTNLVLTSGGGAYADRTWTGTAKEVVFTATGGAVSFIGGQTITVTYGEGQGGGGGSTTVGGGTKEDPYVVATLAEVKEAGKYYKYTGEALVTYRDYHNTANGKYFVQDASAAIMMKGDASVDGFTNLYSEGDKLTNLPLLCEGNNVCVLTSTIQYLSYDNAVEPQVVTLQELTTNAALKYRFVKVEQVSSADAGQAFAVASTFSMTQNNLTVPNSLGCFDAVDANVDVAGHNVPAWMNVAGILDGTVLRPRVWSDVTEIEAPVVTEDGTKEHPYTITKLDEVTSSSSYYKYTGKAYITFKKPTGGAYAYFIEDESCGRILSRNRTADSGNVYENLYRMGDEISGVLLRKYSGDYIYLESYDVAAVSRNNTITPTEITLDKMAENTCRYVKVTDVTSPNAGTVTTSAGKYTLVQGGTTYTDALGCFDSTDAVGQTIPEGKLSITGIINSGVLTMFDEDAMEVMGQNNEPTITLDNSQIIVGGYAPKSYPVVVKGKNLTGDITLELPATVKADKTTITKAEAESENGCQVMLTIVPTESGAFEAKVTFKSEGAAAIELTLKTSAWSTVTVVKEVTSLADVVGKAGTYYVKDVEMAVSYASYGDASSVAYAQTADNAMKLDLSYVGAKVVPADKKLAQGVVFKNFYIQAVAPNALAGATEWTYAIQGTDANGVIDTANPTQFYEITATDNVITPLVVTVDKVGANANRLVKLMNVKFEDITEGQKFEVTESGAYKFPKAYPVVTEEETKSNVTPFLDSDIYGTEIPTYTVNVVGVAGANTIYARSLADITDASAAVPTITLSKADVVLSTKVGETATEKITLTMTDCTKAVVIKAKNEAVTEITLGAMSIEPSAEPVELVVTFAPTKEGEVSQEFEITTEGMEAPVVLKVTGKGEVFVAMVAADADGMYRVYNMNGVLVMETKDAAALNALTPGLYIVNGRKYILR